MSDDTQQPIVVKKIKKGDGGHHGGAWKIAYADFVTAMMAFFLVLWLISQTSEEDLEGIADHFLNPEQVSFINILGGEGVGQSSSVIPGGGEDLTRQLGQVRRGDLERWEFDDSEVEDELRERARLIDLKGRLEAIIEANPRLRSFRHQIVIDITPEGLRIQIVDEQNRPMFSTASDRVQPYMRELLRELGAALNDVPNRLSLSGHTDSVPYAGGERGFSNWELSANRANASRRELIAGGLQPQKVARVVGLADTVPFVDDDPRDSSNRRISIIVMNKRTEQALQDTGSVTEIWVDGSEPAQTVLPDSSRP